MATTTPQGQWRALLRRPGYAGFVVTVSASRIVSLMFTTAGVLLILDRTHSAALAGAVTAASLLPAAVAGPAAGAWLDVVRHRRALMVADQVCSFVSLAGLVVLAGHAPDWTPPAVGVLFGITRPFSVGGFQSALATLAGAELLDRAAAIDATSTNLAVVVGPALAGILAGIVGAARVVELEALLSLVVAAAIAVNPSFEAGPRPPSGGIRETVRAGTRTLLGGGLLRDSATASLLASFTWGMMVVGFPLFAASALHAHRNAGGYLWAALAAGSIVGTFVLPGQPSRRRIGRSCAAVGLSALLWLLAHSVIVAVVLTGVTGFVEGPFYSGSSALRQRLAPEHARAQVLSTLASLNMVAMSAGSVVGGALGDPRTTFVVFAALNVLAAAVVGRKALLRAASG